MATDFNAVINEIINAPKAYYWDRDALSDITIHVANPNPDPNNPSLMLGNFKVTERLDPAGYSALSHEVQYYGSGNVIMEGDNSGKTFCSDGAVRPYWGRPGVYNGPNRSIHDKLIAGGGDDILFGYAGNDTLHGGGGNDILYGGVGNDALYGGDGTDFLFGEAGNDILFGGNNDDWLEGGDGDDELYGGNQHDWLDGGNGDDIIYGEAGNDTLSGGAGLNLLVGGTGDDTYIFAANNGTDIVYEMPDEGFDVCKIEGFTLDDVGFYKSGSHLIIADNTMTNMMQFQDWFTTFAVEEFWFASQGITVDASSLAGLFGIDPTASSTMNNTQETTLTA